MDRNHLEKAIRGTLFRLQPDSADGALLERFLTVRDQAAFEELVRRHGPMVLQVCRRVLGHQQDAEDAFQSTFVLLARKAGSVARMASLGGWLHGVALRTALNARKLRARRARPAGSQAEAGAVAESAAGPSQELQRLDLNSVLDEELDKLPERYRLPVVLCYFEGKTVEDTAQKLGWPSGTVKTQLSRAREVLRDRLSRRGVTLGASGLATVLVEGKLPAAVPGALVNATSQGAALLAGGASTAPGLITAPAAELAAGMQHDLASRKLRWAAALLLVLGGAGITLALIGSRSGLQRSQPMITAQNLEMARGLPPFRRAVFARDDKVLALGDAGGGVNLFEIDWEIGPSRMRELLRLAGPHSSMAFSPDGKTLAAGTPDGTVQLVDLATQRRLATLRTVHPGLVGELIFSPDGQALAGMVAQRGFTIWNLKTQAVQSRIDYTEQAGAAHLALTAKRELFAISSDYRVRCWDATNGQEKPIDFPKVGIVPQPGKPAGKGCVVALTEDASMVVVFGDGSVHLWQRAANRVQHLFTLDPQTVDGVTFLAGPRGDTVACFMHKTNRIAIWDVGLKRELAVIHRPFEGGITARAYSSDGKRFFWSGFAEPAKPGQTSVGSAGGIIDLDIRRNELARTNRQ